MKRASGSEARQTIDARLTEGSPGKRSLETRNTSKVALARCSPGSVLSTGSSGSFSELVKTPETLAVLDDSNPQQGYCSARAEISSALCMSMAESNLGNQEQAPPSEQTLESLQNEGTPSTDKSAEALGAAQQPPAADPHSAPRLTFPASARQEPPTHSVDRSHVFGATEMRNGSIHSHESRGHDQTLHLSKDFSNISLATSSHGSDPHLRPSARIPATKKDPRKLFVGGLPADSKLVLHCFFVLVYRLQRLTLDLYPLARRSN
jgi:hypothetical protein